MEWEFLRAVLIAFGFPRWLVSKITECISSAYFFVFLNGELAGFCSATKGLRQSDHLPLFLFVLAVEVFSSLIKAHTAKLRFKFHWRCGKSGITHLCFTDDVLLFSKSDPKLVKILIGTLSVFANVSGLKVNPAKIFAFMCAVDNATKEQLITQTGFKP